SSTQVAARDSAAASDSSSVSDTNAVRNSLVTPLPVQSDVADSLSAADTLQQGTLEAPAFSTARDSVIEDFSAGRKMIYYYGDVTVKYDKMELTAEYMAYDVDNATVFAKGVEDTAGVVIGKPVMNDGEKTYDMDECYYNFDTKKARVKNAVTKDSEGIMHGAKIKMMPDKSVNVKAGKFTVCDAEHPHYYLRMTTAKVETQPKQKTVVGPA
ncbi:MAG: hypothetical protein KBS57_01570, partial [Alistipes sp.]|nr:hypothetical protein [Candidatus Minthomonas equi]